MKILLSITFLIFILSSCMNPTASIKPDIQKFKETYPNQIQSFAGKNRSMHYAWSGDLQKRPVLFVHGSPGSWEAWAHFLLDSDLQKNFHLIAIDRPGYGGAGQGISVSSLATQAADIVEVLKFNKSHLPAILVGHSFGGPVIAKIAMDYPNQVTGLVFVASSVDPDLESTKWYQYPAGWWPIRSLIPTSLRVCNEEILGLKEQLQLMLPEWKTISAKTVVIQGQADDLVPAENYQFLMQNLKSDVIVNALLVDDLNHFVPWKRPELIVQAIEEINHDLR
jgi:pimeloyl-ACP methyl ester carboxylesterase